MSPATPGLTILSGARAGDAVVFPGDFVTIGRHPSSHIAFDPTRDLDVSARHAALFRQDETWFVRDLGSTNGTWVNGERVRGDRPLAPGDVIRFGPLGPETRFDLAGFGDLTPVPSPRPDRPAAVVSVSLTDTAETRRPDAGPPDPSRPRRAAGFSVPPGRSTLALHAEVARRTVRWRRLTWGSLAAVLMLVTGVAGYVVATRRTEAARRADLLHRVDSLVRIIAATETGTPALDSMLGTVGDAVRAYSAALDNATAREFDSIEAAVSRTVTERAPLLGVAGLDSRGIAEANIDAVALVVAEFRDGRAWTATGFAAVRSGDTAWVVTSRHAVSDSLGRSARRTGVIFHGSAQNFPAEIVARHDSLDLAVLRVVVTGGVPVVRGLDDAGEGTSVGMPVVLISFPRGLDLPMGTRWEETGVSASLFTGTVSRALPSVLQVDGYGAAGSSGSPVFGADGRVVGVLYAGASDTGGRILYAVPARFVRAMLDNDQ